MNYDVIVVGGGLAGCGVAKVLADDGLKVLVLERETQFRDRMRGEILSPWGVKEAQKVGLGHLLEGADVAQISRWISCKEGQVSSDDRNDGDEVASRHFHHPELQEIFLQAARQAGADIRRGVRVSAVQPGQPPTVTFVQDGQEETQQSRLLILADGKNSTMRSKAGFAVNADPERLVGVATLYEGNERFDNAIYEADNHSKGLKALLLSLPRGRSRCYLFYNDHGQRRGLTGEEKHKALQGLMVEAGFPPQLFENAKPIGFLGEFQMNSHWVDHPYKDGVVLIGDAASAPDPTYGAGISLVLKDIRILHDQLAANSDWDAAGHAYAAEQNRVFMTIRKIETLLSDVFMEPGEEADALRERVVPRMEALDPSVFSRDGEATYDESVREMLFAP